MTKGTYEKTVISAFILYAKLNPSEDFYENQRELQLQLMCKEAFKRGFELGVKISVEALGEG